MLSKCYKSTGVDRITWLFRPRNLWQKIQIWDLNESKPKGIVGVISPQKITIFINVEHDKLWWSQNAANQTKSTVNDINIPRYQRKNSRLNCNTLRCKCRSAFRHVGMSIGIWVVLPHLVKLLKVACTSGCKCLYSLVHYFYRNLVLIFIMPRINIFWKYTTIDRFPYHLLC